MNGKLNDLLNCTYIWGQMNQMNPTSPAKESEIVLFSSFSISFVIQGQLWLGAEIFFFYTQLVQLHNHHFSTKSHEVQEK